MTITQIRSSITLIIILLTYFCTAAQPAYDLTNIKLSKNNQQLNDIESSFDRLEKRIDNQKNFKQKKEFKNDIQQYEVEIIAEIKDNEYFRDDILYPYVRSILDSLLLCNGLKHHGYNLLLSRNTTANAYCMIDGTIVVTIGLINHLENKQQLKGILAHELSHDILSHGYTSKLERITYQSSKDYKKKLKNLSKIKYNKQKISSGELKKTIYNSARKSRSEEFEADSLGYDLYNNCEGNPTDFLTALSLRSKYDTLNYEKLNRTTYLQTIKGKNLEFDEKWLTMEDYSGYTYHDKKDEYHKDSLHSHPSDQIRTARIISAYNLDTNSPQSKIDSNYIRISRLAYQHVLPSLITSEKLDIALYYILYRVQYGHPIEHYKDYLKLIFKQLLKARSEYKYNRFVETINPRIHSKEQQQLLSFLWNLSKDDLEYISENL